CPYLHRTTGDTERKYHLRYYKTGTCIHETDARGHCVKNGLHCAFAHGPHDLRPPVYDIRELQAQEALQNGQLGSGDGIPDLQPGVLASQAMIEKILAEDPRWQDTNFVLANYKTEQCTKPPRLCRQGYACPHYHNSRDRRRNPRKFKYRSTPCPSVKHGDEWGEPSKCENGDSCQYCHSRTEQQFHPEIYKSTKCNDMRQTGYCPRGPFCAFAHVEITTLECFLDEWAVATVCVYPHPHFPRKPVVLPSFKVLPLNTRGPDYSILSCTDSEGSGSSSSLSPIGPISRPKSFTNGSLCSEPTRSGVSSPTSTYPKAPGFEREDQYGIYFLKMYKCQNETTPSHTVLQFKAAEKPIYRGPFQNLLNVFSVVNPLASSITSSITSSLASSIGSDSSPPTTVSTMNAKAIPFYPGSNTVESVIGSALDLHFSDINVASLDKELEDQENGHCFLILVGQRLLGSSAPVNIPGSLARSSSLHSSSSLSTSPLSSLSQSFSQSFLSSSMAPHQQSQPAKSEHSALGTSASSHNSLELNLSPSYIWKTHFPPLAIQQWGKSAGCQQPGVGNLWLVSHTWLFKQPNMALESVAGARGAACDAWQKEAQEAKERAKAADADRQLALRKKDETEKKLKKLQEDFDAMCRSPNFSLLQNYGDIEKLPLPKLHSIQSQLRSDLEMIDGVIFQLQSKKCVVCQERNRCIVLQPCQHYVLCEHCAPSKTECPYCK
uniref:Unk like zinc finger n=1 Tax=Latimeria chalumnae TaxID=7897 RepID=H3ALL7_LATCH